MLRHHTFTVSRNNFKMKNLLIILLAIFAISCNTKEKKPATKSEEYIMTHQKDGETIIETVSIQDTTLQNELRRMITDPNYEHRPLENDTIFNDKKNPTLVKLKDHIFGASIQKFEYDQSDRLIKITGYDDQNNIKPYNKDIAIQMKSYSENGNLLEIRNLGADGQLVSAEFEDTPIIRFKYDNQNQIIEESYLNENEVLRTEFGIVKFKYNKQGERIKIGWFNEKGEPK